MMRRRWLNILAVSLTMVGCCALGGCEFAKTSSSSESNSLASEPDDGLGTQYVLNNDGQGYTILAAGQDANETVWNVPSIYKGLPVTAIGDFAASMSKCTKVVLPDTITTIGTWAFMDCPNLKSIDLGNGVTTIGERAFGNCGNLTSIAIPDSVTTMGGLLFYECRNLTDVTIGKNVTAIEAFAFQNCTQLQSIKIPDSVTSIGECAFTSCTSLSSVEFGVGVTSIGYGAFSFCESLTSIAIPDGVTVINDHTFACCRNLTSVVLHDGITSMEGSDTVTECYKLENIYYKGTEESWTEKPWKDLLIGGTWNALDDLTRYYYSETEQSGCWHYDENGQPVLW